MQFTIWVTNNCNLQCQYCYEGKDKQRNKMSINTANKVLEFVKSKIDYEHSKDDFDSIEFHGGEPLLNYEVIQYMIKEIKTWKNQEKIYMSLTTNAILLTEDKISYLTNNLNELSISIDGTEKAHDINRKCIDGTGSFKYIINNVKNLINQGNKRCGLRARMTVTPNTAKYVYLSVKFLVSLGFDNVVPVIDNFSEWSEKDIEKVYLECIKVYDEIYLKRKDLLVGLIDNIAMRRESVCLAGEQTVHISPDGSLFPCAYVVNKDEFILGCVDTGINKNILNKIKKINTREISNCSSCAWKHLCTANRCKLLNYAITGDYYKPAISTCMNEHLLLKIHKYKKR